MPEHTRELIHRYYDAFNRQDMAAFAGLLAEEVVHDANEGGRRQGRDAFLGFMERMNTAYREQISDLEILASADGSRAAAEYTVDGVYLATDEGLPPARGQRYRLRGGAFFEVAAGRISRVTNYYNLAAWLEQVS